MIIASSADRAMTVREWDPVLQRSAWGYGPCRAPLPDSHGSVNWRRLQNFPSHGSLKRKRGVGEHPESPRLGCLPRLRPLRPPIVLPSNQMKFQLSQLTSYGS